MKRPPKPFEYEMPSDLFLKRAEADARNGGLNLNQALILINAVKHANKVLKKRKERRND